MPKILIKQSLLITFAVDHKPDGGLVTSQERRGMDEGTGVWLKAGLWIEALKQDWTYLWHKSFKIAGHEEGRVLKTLSDSTRSF
jgi:hypothetical protein